MKRKNLLSMLFFYKLLGFILLPFIKINLYLRILKKKEDKKRFIERYGYSSKKRPSGKLIWIHTASIGEFKSVIKIIEKIHHKHTILLTTTTTTASEYAKKEFGNKIIHQYAPYDVYIWVNRFLNNWKPTLVLWVESDLWPITLNIIRKKSIRSILLNSRISPKSYNIWKYFNNFFKEITLTFDEIYAQSQLDKKRLEFLTKRKIFFIGNLKLSLKEKLNNMLLYRKLEKKLKNYKIILFASTHDGEEEMFLKTIKEILKKYSNVKIIIAPRHPIRANSIVNILNQKKLNSQILSKSKKLQENIFVINSFGQMNIYYNLSKIVVLGGSFSKMGGHNPIEVAQNNCVVITGPHIYNWENIYLDMIKKDSCFYCKNPFETEKILINLLKNNNKIERFSSNAKKFAKDNLVKIDSFVKLINKQLNKTKC